MAEDPKSDFIRRINFDSPKAAPTVLTIGSGIWKLTAELANVDFILSVREERLAMMFQFMLDYGWLILCMVGVVWVLQAHRNPDKDRIHWGMVLSASILSFMAGILVSVYATGSLPNVMQGWGGEKTAQICSAQVDTSRLIGFKNNYRVVLICGGSDPKIDPQEDDRIAVSSAFHITGSSLIVTAPFGKLSERNDEIKPGSGFLLWHTVVVLPKDSNPSSIKRVSDVPRQGGRIVTDPPAGGLGGPIGINTPTASP